MAARPAHLLTLCFLLVATSGVVAQTAPPTNLQLVNGHWTAWEPPTLFPPGVETYTIQTGDTLWDLANQFYGDPYLWPQLWEANQYILDAHWIYPGDPLVIGVEVTQAEDLASVGPDAAPTEPEPVDDGTGIRSAAAAGRGPYPLGTETDIYCSGFIGDPALEFPFSIIGSESEALIPRLNNDQSALGIHDTVRYGMVTGDIVYVDGGLASGMTPGDLLTVVEPQALVDHPSTRKPYGRLYRYKGRLRILSVQAEAAIAEISAACDAITVGSLLVPFEPEPVPLARLTAVRPVNLPSPAAQLVDAPMIIAGNDSVVSLGEDSVVYVDRGDDELTPGDIMTIYRLHRRDLPPVVIGEVGILSVNERSAVGKILSSRYAVYIGDRLELK